MTVVVPRWNAGGGTQRDVGTANGRSCRDGTNGGSHASPRRVSVDQTLGARLDAVSCCRSGAGTAHDHARERGARRRAGERRQHQLRPRRSVPMAAGWRSSPVPATWCWATRTARSTSSSATSRRRRRRGSASGPAVPKANGTSSCPAISGDGRWVAFESSASNLVAGDTNGQQDVFVHDRQTGTTTRVSVGPRAPRPTMTAAAPSISADGRWVAFDSCASNLVAGDTNGVNDVFVHDRQTGTTTRVSVGPGGAQANAGSGAPAISADGRWVAFASWASNLVAGDTNGRATCSSATCRRGRRRG